MKTYGQYVRMGEHGVPELCPFDYLDYYEANIHPYDELSFGEERKRVYEGITVKEFHLQHKEGFLDIVQPLLQDERLSQLKDDLEKEGKQVCMFNMYILAKFLVERGKSRFLFLLKPSISDTLSSLNEVSEITFTNKDGSIVKSTSDTLIKKVMEILETEKNTKIYEVEKIVTWDKVSNNSVMQSYFVNDLTMFLNKYFPVKRKKNALVSTKEVELILYLMKLLGLSTFELTNKRYWQLMKTYKEIDKHVADYGQFNLDGMTIITPLYFIPYSMWSNGKIEWESKDMPKFNGEIGTIIKF